ncbi:MAG: DUF5673 domain-containing protein [Lagierella massiliensis]|nr:DUF5673 domain-containing protein [Lagierella massiliensis]
MDYKSFLNIIYIIIMLVVLGQIYGIYNAKKSDKGNLIAYFNPHSRFLIAFLAGMLVLLAAYTLTLKDYFGIVYLISGFGFAYIAYQKIYLHENGILYGSKFTKWEDIKKWSYNERTKNLQLVTGSGKRQKRIIPVALDDKSQVMTIIKQKKKR